MNKRKDEKGEIFKKEKINDSDIETYHRWNLDTHLFESTIKELLEQQNKRKPDENNKKGLIKLARKLIHDIAQPLTVVLGRSELLYRLVSDDKNFIKHIDAILINTRRLNELIGKIHSILMEIDDENNNVDGGDNEK